MDALKEAGFDVISIGKIRDIFDGEGITQAIRSKSSVQGMEQTIECLDQDFTGLCFTNLVDFDALWGHRRNPLGYAEELEKFDVLLGQFLEKMNEDDLVIVTAAHTNNDSGSTPGIPSHLSQWPVQIKLVPTSAPWFDGANLLVAADCTAYAYGKFHNKFIKNRITLIGCPKLDSVDYTEKLTEIIRNNDIKSVTVVRMEVPCCAGIENAVKTALQNSGKFIPWHVAIVTVDGQLTEM